MAERSHATGPFTCDVKVLPGDGRRRNLVAKETSYINLFVLSRIGKIFRGSSPLLICGTRRPEIAMSRISKALHFHHPPFPSNGGGKLTYQVKMVRMLGDIPSISFSDDPHAALRAVAGKSKFRNTGEKVLHHAVLGFTREGYGRNHIRPSLSLRSRFRQGHFIEGQHFF